MSEPSQGTGPSQAEIEAIHLRIQKDKTFQNGTSWFYWVAALSGITTVVSLSGGSWGFLAGLGATQVLDGLTLALAGEAAAPVFRGVLVALSLLISASVALFGYLSRRKGGWVFLTGIVLYGLDTLVLLAFQEWFSVAFHLFALVQMVIGYRAWRWLQSAVADSTEAELPA